MDIKYHCLFGFTVITAKVNYMGKTSWYVTKAQIDKRQALIALFDMIERDNPVLSYAEMQPDKLTT